MNGNLAALLFVENQWLFFRPNHVTARDSWSNQDDVIKWKHFPRYWPFVRGIHRSSLNSSQRPVTRSFDALFDVRVNKRLRKQSWGWWFERPSRPIWRHCNDITRYWTQYERKILFRLWVLWRLFLTYLENRNRGISRVQHTSDINVCIINALQIIAANSN